MRAMYALGTPCHVSTRAVALTPVARARERSSVRAREINPRTPSSMSSSSSSSWMSPMSASSSSSWMSSMSASAAASACVARKCIVLSSLQLTPRARRVSRHRRRRARESPIHAS